MRKFARLRLVAQYVSRPISRRTPTVTRSTERLAQTASQAGVRVFSYLEDREVLLDTPTDKFLMSAMSFAAEVEREKARQRVQDAMKRKARAGHVGSGHLFGYVIRQTAQREMSLRELW